MRFMLTMTIPPAGGNDAMKSGALMEAMGELIKTRRVEQSWFTARGGDRTAHFVLQLEEVSDMPSILEPFWTLASAKIEFTPVMNWEELQSGVRKLLGK